MIRSATWRRVATSVLAATTALVLVAPSAGAAATGPAQFSGAAEALTFHLQLTAPDALLGPIGAKNGKLDQKVSATLAELSSVGDASATTTLLEGLYNQTRSSADGNCGSESLAEIAPQDTAGIVSLGIGTMECTADSAANLSRSFSELANLSISLEPLFSDSSALPEDVRTALQDAVGAATGTVNELAGELNGALGEVENAVNDASGAVEEGTGVDIPDVTPDQLPEVPDITKVNLLDVRKMWAESVITTEADSVLSTSESGIVEASLLGGLVKVPTFQYETVARANGQPGGASADAKVTTIAVQVAGEALVAVEGTKLTVGDFTLDLNDPEFGELDGSEVLGPVTDLLTEILDAVGVSVAQGTTSTSTAEDGSKAEASTSAFALSLHPLNAAGDDANALFGLDLNLLQTKSVVAASPNPPTESDPPPAAPDPPVHLPRTGGGAVPMIVGLLAMAGALGLKQRMR